MKSMSGNKQSGAVSLFVVIFAMLMITVITMSFLRLMMADQRQATDNDLSQSAYDSAQAGVEDAKRALLRYQRVCATTPSDCDTLGAALATTECNAALRLGDVVRPGDEANGAAGSTGEIKVQQSESGSDSALDQAYTCVTMQLRTNDYIGSSSALQSQLVPLVGETAFDTVTVSWYSKDDITSVDGSVVLPGVSATHPLPRQSDWNVNTPSVLRAQLIQFGSSFTLDSLDYVGASGESNANTVFLYPTSGAGTTTETFTGLDTRRTDANDEPDPDSATQTPHAVQCQASINAGGYACSMSLTLPTPVGGGDRTAFLRLTPFYNATHFQVVLYAGGSPSNGGSIVRFKDVQPIIDSTGRANDVFRRVQSRVNLYNTNFPYPDGAIDITNNFCKSFGVSDDPNTYVTTNNCTP